MALTNTELRSLLKANLHSDTTYTDPGDLNTFLTLGQERIVHDSPHTLGPKQGTLSLTVAAGRSYDLASDFYQMKAIFYPTSGVWLEPVMAGEWIEIVETLSSIPSGEPDQYTIRWDVTNALWQVVFNMTPSASMTYYYWYYPMPAAISGAGTCLISSIGFSALLLEAATMIALSRNDPDGAAVAATNYARLLPDYRSYNTMGPDYVPVLRPGMSRASTNQLGPHFPADW
jgi:hypothetical protein